MKTLRSHRSLAAVAAFGAAGVVAATLALTGAAGAVPATGPLLPVRGTPVPDSWVVTLAGPATGPTEVRAAAADLSSRYAGSLRHTYTRAVRGFAVRMSEARARRLAADPRVASVQQDVLVRTQATQTTDNSTWGLDRIDQRRLPLSRTYTYSTTAANVRAYVIDTGIRTAHTDFGGRAQVGADFVGDGRNGQDCDGHGTHVAGTIGGTRYGVAKGVSLVSVRALPCSGAGPVSAVIAAVEWVTVNAVRPAVANLSLGTDTAFSALDLAVRTSVLSGVTYTVAAGNDGDDEFANNDDACGHSPARTPEAVTVGATTITDARAGFSNTGPCLDLFAPGNAITSTWYTSNTATAVLSGTSMAAPHAAGAAALYLATRPTASSAEVQAALVAAATPGVVTDPRTGSPNRLLYTGTGTTTPTPTPTATPTTRPPTPTPTATTRPPTPTPTTTRPPTPTPTTTRPPTPTPTTTRPPTPTPTTTRPATPSPTTTRPATPSPTTTRPPSPTPYQGLPIARPTTPAPTTSRPPTIAPTTTRPPSGTVPTVTGTLNDIDVPIPDMATAQSALLVVGRVGPAPAALRVAVRAVHPYRGDLAVELVAPDGRVIRLKNATTFDGAADLDLVFTVNASASPMSGLWLLRVRDSYAEDVGHLDRWSLLI